MAQQLTFMAVHAHPDDEIFGTGGVFAKYAAQGINTVLVTCTGGEEGEIVDPEMDVAEVQPRLREVRAAELECAVAKLGIGHLEWLGYRDSGMAGTPANQNPASFHMADPEEATRRLVRLVRHYRPQVLVSYDENGSYGHPDHIQAHLITGMAFDTAADPGRYPGTGPAWQPKKLYYCGFSHKQFQRLLEIVEELHLEVDWPRRPQPDDQPRGLPDERITTIVDIRPYLEQKRAAMLCHRTQIRVDEVLFRIPPEAAARALGEEQFIRVRSLVNAALPEDDLFAGLR
jgi:mycothiol conjugate amidase Mca